MRILFVFGTRPEAIKMAPLVRRFKEQPDFFDVKVCATAQHRQLLDQVLDFFEIQSDFDLNLMQPRQTLFDITARCLTGLQGVLQEWRPDLVLVQGDTTSTFAGALAAYYCQVKVAHIEAGLRSNNKYSPYPEELNRRLTGQLTDFHFPPTQRARDALAREGITDNVWVVGNTVIDALLIGLDIVSRKSEQKFYDDFPNVDFSKRIILVTGHRRESFGEPFEHLCLALRDIARGFDDVQLVYPVHLNPNVKEPVDRILKGEPNVLLTESLDYPHLIWLMNKSTLVLTDSGGIQEEAPTLGKPVLVMRDVTERIEGVEAGTAKLVGTNRQAIFDNAVRLLTDPAAYDAMAHVANPYGDGTTSQQIRDIIRSQFESNT